MDRKAQLDHDFGVSGWRKKKIEADLDELAETGKTTNPYLSRILLAQHINQASGGAVIAPWDVQELPDDWLDAFRLFGTSLRDRMKVKQIIDKKKQDWLSKFKHYRKN